VAVAGKRRLRIVAKRVPGLPMAYRAFLKRAVLRRGRAVLDYADARIQIHVTTESIVH
jgi:hypothetical protein